MNIFWLSINVPVIYPHKLKRTSQLDLPPNSPTSTQQQSLSQATVVIAVVRSLRSAHFNSSCALLFTHPDVDAMATQVVGNATSLSFIEVDVAGMVRT